MHVDGAAESALLAETTLALFRVWVVTLSKEIPINKDPSLLSIEH